MQEITISLSGLTIAVVSGERWGQDRRVAQKPASGVGLRVLVRRRGKRVGFSTAEAPQAGAECGVGVVDIQSDAEEIGWMVKIASIVDEHTGECLGGIVAPSITGDDLTRGEIGPMPGIPQAVEFGEHYYHQHSVPAPPPPGQTRALI